MQDFCSSLTRTPTSTNILSRALMFVCVILQMSRSSVSVNFIELLYSLGWPVRVDQHVGWTGHLSTSYKISCKLLTISVTRVTLLRLFYARIYISDGNERRTEQERSQFDPNMETNLDDGVCLYDGSGKVLYWCDAISEVAFVVPSLCQQSSSGSNISETCDILKSTTKRKVME